MYDVGGSSSGADSGYSDLVPHLASIDDFLSASRSAVQQNKMLVVKFYSKRCRACLRIAAKYRRIARRYGEQVACYEMEQHAAGRELLELLAVEQVPTTPAITTPALATATVTIPALATAACLRRPGAHDPDLRRSRHPPARQPRLPARSVQAGGANHRRDDRGEDTAARGSRCRECARRDGARSRPSGERPRQE